MPQSFDRFCMSALRRGGVLLSAVFMAVIVYLVVQVKSSTIQPFIYFQF
jgi:hypothetical protein